ncbi:MAG: response regulator [Phormidesmis sp. RL_2_1]|nr:response regulator [Phormidesmis sp. RL_2_1]
MTTTASDTAQAVTPENTSQKTDHKKTDSKKAASKKVKPEKIVQTNILLVEDDKVDVMNVRRSFKKANITNPLYVASNGIEALEILRGQSAHIKMPQHRRLVLSDINMPKMGGIEFLKALRADDKLRATTVIVLTTSDQECDRIEAYKLNVAGYIVKPVTFAKFAEVVAALDRYWTLCEIP